MYTFYEHEIEALKLLFVLLYADDTVLISETKNDMQALINETVDYFEIFDILN